MFSAQENPIKQISSKLKRWGCHPWLICRGMPQIFNVIKLMWNIHQFGHLWSGGARRNKGAPCLFNPCPHIWNSHPRTHGGGVGTPTRAVSPLSMLELRDKNYTNYNYIATKNHTTNRPSGPWWHDKKWGHTSKTTNHKLLKFLGNMCKGLTSCYTKFQISS